MFFPPIERFTDSIYVKARVVGLAYRFLEIITLKFDCIFPVATYFFARPPGLGIKHGAGEPLVLQAKIKQLGIMDQCNPIIKVRYSEPICGFKAKVIE